MRSIALTWVPLPPSAAERNARQVLVPAPGLLISAIAAQILSAPRRPAPAPVSPKRRSPPKPRLFLDRSCNALRLVAKKLKWAPLPVAPPAAPAAPPLPDLPPDPVVAPPVPAEPPL